MLATLHFISAGSKEVALLTQHSRIMSYSESMSTISRNVGSFALGQGAGLCARISFGLWAIAEGKGTASVTPKGIDITYPAQYLPLSSPFN